MRYNYRVHRRSVHSGGVLMLKVSIVIIVVLWISGTLSSYSFPWYFHVVSLLLAGLLLVKLSRLAKAQPIENTLQRRSSEDHRYTI